jgi:hypothetical protein
VRGIICALLLVGSSTGVIGVLALMWVQDSVRVCEPYIGVRVFEIQIAFAMWCYGFYYLCHCVKQRRNGKRGR